jgi:hypothetical protein
VRRTKEDRIGEIIKEKRDGEHTEDNCGCGCDFVRLHNVLNDYDVDVEPET